MDVGAPNTPKKIRGIRPLIQHNVRLYTTQHTQSTVMCIHMPTKHGARLALFLFSQNIIS